MCTNDIFVYVIHIYVCLLSDVDSPVSIMSQSDEDDEEISLIHPSPTSSPVPPPQRPATANSPDTRVDHPISTDDPRVRADSASSMVPLERRKEHSSAPQLSVAEYMTKLDKSLNLKGKYIFVGKQKL